MSTSTAQISDMLVTVKARQIQQAMLAEMHGDADAARRHFLAAAHLELVLAHDYDNAGDETSAFRSRLSSASCLWRGGEVAQGRRALKALQTQAPEQKAAIKQALDELTHDFGAAHAKPKQARGKDQGRRNRPRHQQ